MGLGKAQPYSSGILTPTGWKRLGNIRIGDSVTSSQGKITTVTGVYPQGLKKIVKVSFSDGVSVECCEEHLWRVYVHERKVWMTLATSQLRKYISTSPHPLPLEVPLVGAVHFSEQIIPPVNSYQFGLVLGLLCQGVDIDSCCEKEDVLLFHLDSDCNIKEYQALLGDITLLQSIDTTGFNVADIRRILELSRFFEGNQQICIPEILLRASVTSRVKLLSGILDAAGNVEDQISLRVSSRSYSESISELIRSLGGVVRCEIIPGIHCLQIQVPFNPFSLSMKKKWYEANSEKLQPHRYITSIVSLREDDALCISVASPDKLYVTDHYTVTHNTIQAIASTAMYQNEWPVLVFTPSSARYHWKVHHSCYFLIIFLSQRY